MPADSRPAVAFQFAASPPRATVNDGGRASIRDGPPAILGGGTPYFTPLTEPLDLRPTESRTFTSCVVYLRYQRMR